MMISVHPKICIEARSALFEPTLKATDRSCYETDTQDRSRKVSSVVFDLRMHAVPSRHAEEAKNL